MFIRSGEFDPTLTQPQVDDIINSLAVNAYDFSVIACLDGKAYGVTTNCENCTIDINYCMRNELSRKLYASQIKAQFDLGYDISVQYHSYKVPFGYSGKLRLPHNNVSAVNVIQAYSVVEDYDGIAISPYIEEDITIEQQGDYCVAIFSAALVDNPRKAMIRDSNGRLYEQQEVATYPKRIAGNWHVPIIGIRAPCTSDLTFNVQHCELIRVSMTTPVCAGRVKPCYPGTHQVIPTYKTEVSGGNTILWFHVWVLARPEFMDDEGGINFAQGQFYKLFDSLDMVCFTDAAKSPVITVMASEDCTWEFTESTSTNEPAVSLLDEEIGLVYVDTRLFTCTDCDFSIETCPAEYPVSIEIWYKTDPRVSRRQFNYVAIRDAVTYFAAAELPTSVCQCSMTEGFIFKAQSAFLDQKINPFTGEVVTNMKYNDVYGRVRYYELLKDVYQMQRYGVA